MQKEYIEKIDKFWSEKVKNKSNKATRWWESNYIKTHINGKFSTTETSQFSGGILNFFKKNYYTSPFKKGVSIGCGNGSKEMALLKSGIVEKFDLYELSKSRIEEGKLLAKRMNLDDKVTFFHEDVFQKTDVKYDFVHWNNSLHHMPDTNFAVKWSYNCLEKGGVFYMDDFVGPNRFQWTGKMLDVCNKINEILPDHLLKSPNDDNVILRKKTVKPKFEDMKRVDPSEAGDSENIIPSVLKYFPDAYVKYTGGVVYHLALKDIIHNFENEESAFVLDLLLLIDQLLSELGENHYAVAIAKK